MKVPKGSLMPTVGVSFGLPNTGGAYGGYQQNPVGTGGAVNPYYDSPNGLSVGAVDVNPLVSFQATTDDDGKPVAKPLINLHLTPNGCGIFGCEADDYYHNRKQAAGAGSGGLLSAATDFLFPKKKKQSPQPSYDYYQPDQQYYRPPEQYPEPQYQHDQDDYIPYPPATGPGYQSNRKQFFPDPTPPHTTPTHHGHRTNGNVNFFDGSSLSTKKIKFDPSPLGPVVKHEHHHYHHHDHRHGARQQQGGGGGLYYDDAFQRSVDGGTAIGQEEDNGSFVPAVVGTSEVVPVSAARGKEDKGKGDGGAFRFPAAGRSLRFGGDDAGEADEEQGQEGEEDKSVKSRRRRSADHGPGEGEHHHGHGEEDKTSAQSSQTEVSGQVQPVRTELFS